MNFLQISEANLSFEGVYWLGWWMGRRSLIKYKRIIDDIMRSKR